MILRIDRLGVDLPGPSTPDPNGAAAVQELMGGKFGEMSTLMNYTFQSFNFRDRKSIRPFYDLIANIAAEEFGHIELVAATINTMLTGASLADAKDGAYKQHYLFGGKGALPGRLARQAVGRQLRALLGRPDRGPHAQLLPRDRRAQRQAARLRDGRARGGARADRATCSSAAACIRSPTPARSST